MSTSKLGNKHYFIFQHRDLVWSWNVSQEVLEQHKHKVFPAVEERKHCGIDKITNAFTDYDSDDMEMKVYNGCIEHAFGVRGDITQQDERIHWLYISNGEKGKYLELEELEDKGLQLSYLSKSFSDNDIMNIDTLVAWSKVGDDSENDDDASEEEKRIVRDTFRTILHTEVLFHMLRVVGGGLKKQKITDERDLFLFNEIFNVNTHKIKSALNHKQFVSDMKTFGANNLLEGLQNLTKSLEKYCDDLYGNNHIENHIKYTFFNSWDRYGRNKIRGNKKIFSIVKSIVDNPITNMNKMVNVFDYLNK